MVTRNLRLTAFIVLAAVKGNIDAVRLRREIADQMSEFEIVAAQRAARDWLGAH